MKINEKMALFVAGTQLDIAPVATGNLRRIQIRHPRFLANCIFERAVTLSSPAIGKTGRPFFGAHSYMNNGGYLRSETFIGRYCSVGRRVTIGAAMHDMAGLSTSPTLRGPLAAPEPEQLAAARTRPAITVLMNDVWVGDGAVILPGVTLGTGAVIGANAVVTRDVPPYAVMAGCPARILKYRFPEEIIAQLLDSEWWEIPKATLSEMPLENILDFIAALRDLAPDQRESALPSYEIVAASPG